MICARAPNDWSYVSNLSMLHQTPGQREAIPPAFPSSWLVRSTLLESAHVAKVEACSAISIFFFCSWAVAATLAYQHWFAFVSVVVVGAVSALHMRRDLACSDALGALGARLGFV